MEFGYLILAAAIAFTGGGAAWLYLLVRPRGRRAAV